MASLNHTLHDTTNRNEYTHVQFPIKRDATDGTIGYIQHIDIGDITGFGYSTTSYSDEAHILNFQTFVQVIDKLFKDLNSKINVINELLANLGSQIQSISWTGYSLGSNSITTTSNVTILNYGKLNITKADGSNEEKTLGKDDIGGIIQIEGADSITYTGSGNAILSKNSVGQIKIWCTYGGCTSTVETINVSAGIVDVSSISINTSSLTIAANGTGRLTGTISPSNASNKTINWQSSNNSIATVTSSTQSGSQATVTWHSAGTVTITASAAGNTSKTATCQVTCEEVIPDTYTVTVNVTNGSSSPISRTVNSGGTASFTITPNSGYQLPSSVTGASISDHTLIVSNVTSNKTINVTCNALTYTVTLNVINGSKSPNTTQVVNYGGSVSWTVTPNSGYQLDGSLVPGASISGNTVTVNNVTSNKTITVTCTSLGNNYYLGVDTKDTYTTSDLTQYVASKPSTITIPAGQWGTWIYPASWGRPISAISNLSNQDEISAFNYSDLTLPEGYIGMWIELGSETTYALTW